MPTGDTVGISRPVWLHFLVVLALTSQYKAGKQFPCWSLPRTPRPQPGTVCFLRKYRHEVLCAGARRDLAGCPVSPSFSGAGVGGGFCLGRLQGLTTPQATKMHLQLSSCEESLGQSGGVLSLCQLPHLAKATGRPGRTDWESRERAPLLRDRNLVFLSE